jgi:hydrophobe/amphiphile efflux-1 (HAE1) family protein
VPRGFIPDQDQGYLIIDGQLPEGASLQRTDAVAKEVIEIASKTEGVANTVGIVGYSAATRSNSSNAFAVFLPLDPFQDRKDTELKAAALSARMNKEVSGIQEARVIVIPPPPVRGLGTGGGFKLYVQDRQNARLQTLESVTDDLGAAIMAEPAVGFSYTTFRTGTPLFYADIDRTKAKMLDVPLGNVFGALQTFLGSSYVNDMNLFGRTFRVIAQADAPFRTSPEDIQVIKVRSNSGAMVPLGSFVTMTRTVGPNRVERFNMYPAAPLNGTTSLGFSSGQSLQAVEDVASKTLPQGMNIEWTDIAFQEKLAGNTALFIFPLCVLFVFLTLAAQYESWSLPMAIILIVPMCLLSAIAGIWFRGMDNNILTQIGFVVLVGLACKNAILIVEFAKQQQETGMSRFEAAVEACRLRLRPILMTSFAFILGVVPLMLAGGPGAENRQSLGTAVFFGMLGVTFFGIFLTPVFYAVIMKFVDARVQRKAARAETSAISDHV